MDTSLPLYRRTVRSSDNLTKTYYSLVVLALVVIIPFTTLTGADQTHDQTTLGTWYNVPTSCTNHDNCELFGNGMNISNENWGLRGIFSVGNNTYLGSVGIQLAGFQAHLNLDCIDRTGGISAPDNKLNFTLEYSIYGDYNGPASSPPTYSSNLTGWQALESVPVDADPTGATARQGCTNYAQPPTATSRWTATGPDVALNSTAKPLPNGLIDCTAATVASCGYIFRVILCCASTPGTNVQIGSVSVTILQTFRRLFGASTSSTTTTLTYNLLTDRPFPINQAVTFLWSADNVSSTGRCGLGATSTFHCWETNTSSCTFLTGSTICSGTITYATAFTGTVRALIQNTRQGTSDILTIPVTTITLFSAQPVPNV